MGCSTWGPGHILLRSNPEIFHCKRHWTVRHRVEATPSLKEHPF